MQLPRLQFFRLLWDQGPDLYASLLFTRLACSQASQLRQPAAAGLLRLTAYRYTPCMLVFGGWTTRVRVMGCAREAALAALWLFGCGSRSSALETDIYDPAYSGAGGSSSVAGGSGGPAKAGSNASAGQSSLPTAGTGSGGASADPDPSFAACQKYCAAYAPKCPERLDDPDCVNACVREMSSHDASCRRHGLRTLKCLTPFFKKPELSCDSAVDQALVQCQKHVSAFAECKRGGAPVPEPTEPGPLPGPAPIPATCPSIARGDSSTCFLEYNCPEGLYSVSCYALMSPSDARSYSCTCYWPGGAGVGFTSPGASSPCDYGSQHCGFSSPSLK